VIKATNYISAKVLLILAVLKLRFVPTFNIKFTQVEHKLIEINTRKTEFPQNLILSLIKIEDKRFFDHSGIDLYSILRALCKNTMTNRLEGASTIVQQLIRNILDEREITVNRKFNEIMLATLISREFTKNEIMFAYIDTYRFNSCVGVYNLCLKENYDLDNLSYNEAAQIAARFKYPTINKFNYIKYLKRVRTIEIKNNIRASSMLMIFSVLH